jgi:hypothetical protein
VPRELVTVAFRLEPLGPQQRHAEDFTRRSGFTYTVIDGSDGEIVGCVYIYPTDTAGSAASDDDPAAAANGAQVRSWVRSDRAELDVQVHDAVTDWLQTAWPFLVVNYAAR